MTEKYTVGGYVESWCTKCKLELGHTIVAIVENAPKRVKCNTCNGLHNFRTKLAVTSRAKSTKTGRKKKSPEEDYNELLATITGGDLSSARKYSINGNYTKDDIVDHSRFGIGIVVSVINPHKMDILFKDGSKLLVQNQEQR